MYLFTKFHLFSYSEFFPVESLEGGVHCESHHVHPEEKSLKDFIM